MSRNPKIWIKGLTENERLLIKDLYTNCIPVVFELEGLSYLDSVILEEIRFKHRLIDESLTHEHPSTIFLVAMLESDVVGAISIGSCGKEIMECTHQEWTTLNEVGSLYVHPHFQNQGIGSILIHEAVKKLDEQGNDEFCLDSGYQHAQKKWLKKFGDPTILVKDYWGIGLDHMLWRIKVKDILK